MSRAITRSVALATGAGLLFTIAGTGLVAPPPAAVATPAATSASEREAVRSFYAAQSFTSPANRAVLELPRSVRIASNAKVDYFRDFYNAYAENPAVQVRSMKVRSKVLKKKMVAAGTQYTVSVSVEFSLYDREAKQPFTGGETMDHLLTVKTNGMAAGSSAAGSGLTVTSDRNLGMSTAPVQAADDADEIAAVDPTYVMPTEQRKKKQALYATRITSQRVTAAASNPFPRLDYQKAVNYAAKWTDSKHENVVNTDPYPKLKDNNCTNFVSQTLHQGGWKKQDTVWLNRKKLKYWDYNMSGPGKMTYTWSKAQFNYDRLDQLAGLRKFGKMEDAWLLDIVYFDWNVGGSNYGGELDHAMITTRIIDNKPYFSQKSGNRHNVPISQVKKNIKDGGGTKYKVYGLRT